jgi:hypothetical protein
MQHDNSLHAPNGTKHRMPKLRGRQLNPGLPRDRRKCQPLYYTGFGEHTPTKKRDRYNNGKPSLDTPRHQSTNASAGNRTRVTSMATMYSTTRPLMLTQMTTAAPTGPHQRPNLKIAQNWSRAVSARQRSLHSTLGCVPTTAGSAQFCLLCCQPEPVPESLPARPPPLTRGCPCRLPVW